MELLSGEFWAGDPHPALDRLRQQQPVWWDERSGGFEPLRQVPEDRTVVLGLVSSKKAALEAKHELKQRIAAAAAFVPLDRLALSPQCGFASTLEGNLITAADQEAKLRLVAETAREVWGQPAVAGKLQSMSG